MSSASKIEWTEQTWNPLVGCTIVSPGCTHCYAMKDAYRKGFNPKTPSYHGLTKQVNGHAVWTGEVRMATEATLLAPLRRKNPTMYFVNSMSDLFHESVPDEWIDRIFAVMALTPQHTYQVLTKRAERMREYLQGNVWGRIYKAAVALAPDHERNAHLGYLLAGLGTEPRVIPNCWLGVSTERQKEADERIPHLLQTPAAVRFISAEPLLGAIDLTNIAPPDNGYGGEAHGIDTLSSFNRRLRGVLDWVIVGGESGLITRPMHPQWARDLRDQCKAAGVPFFFKQWGAWAPHHVRPGADLGGDVRAGRVRIVHPSGKSLAEVFEATGGRSTEPGSRYMEIVGKKAAGRLLDNRTHDDMPGRVAMASHHD